MNPDQQTQDWVDKIRANMSTPNTPPTEDAISTATQHHHELLVHLIEEQIFIAEGALKAIKMLQSGTKGHALERCASRLMAALATAVDNAKELACPVVPNRYFSLSMLKEQFGNKAVHAMQPTVRKEIRILAASLVEAMDDEIEGKAQAFTNWMMDLRVLYAQAAIQADGEKVEVVLSEPPTPVEQP